MPLNTVPKNKNKNLALIGKKLKQWFTRCYVQGQFFGYRYYLHLSTKNKFKK